MTEVALVGLTVAVGVLGVLVVGLLRSHAEILRRLHAIDPDGDATGANREPATSAAAPRVAPGTLAPPDAPTGRQAHDIVGVDLAGAPVALRVVGAATDTLLLFLQSGCGSCEDVWEAWRAHRARVPEGLRPVIVVGDLDRESPSALADLAPDDVTVVASTAAWEAYAVPGSPYAVHVDGPLGRVSGEGTAPTWDRMAELLAEGSGDVGYLADPSAPRKRPADAERERDADAALLAAGIVPGDERLYPDPVASDA